MPCHARPGQARPGRRRDTHAMLSPVSRILALRPARQCRRRCHHDCSVTDVPAPPACCVQRAWASCGRIRHWASMPRRTAARTHAHAHMRVRKRAVGMRREQQSAAARPLSSATRSGGVARHASSVAAIPTPAVGSTPLHTPRGRPGSVWTGDCSTAACRPSSQDAPSITDPRQMDSKRAWPLPFRADSGWGHGMSASKYGRCSRLGRAIAVRPCI